MHEHSLCNALVHCLTEVARRENANAIQEVTLSAHAGHRLDEMTMQYAFNVAAQGTVAVGAVLKWMIRPVQLYCAVGHGRWLADEMLVQCPVCGVYLSCDSGNDFGLLIVDVSLSVPRVTEVDTHSADYPCAATARNVGM